MKTLGCFKMLLMPFYFLALVSVVAADPPDKTYAFAVLKPAAESWSALGRFGCEKSLGDTDSKEQQFSFVSCESPVPVVSIGTEIGWQMQPVAQYDNLSFARSLKIAVDAFVDPEAVGNTQVRYFFPAKGDSLKAKEAWINAIGIKLVGAGIDSAVTSKNRDQTYSAVAELSMAEMLVGGSVATWGAAGAEVGISFPIQDYKKLNGVPDVGLKNGTKIVTFDQYSKAEK